MKLEIAAPNPSICAEVEIAGWNPEVIRSQHAWERKMTLLEEIHREISPQLQDLIARYDDDFPKDSFDGIGTA